MLLETKHLQDFPNTIFVREREREKEVDKMGVGRH